MAKSALFKYYSDKLARVKSPDELLALSREISTKSFKANEKAALSLSCVYIAKQFDKQNKKLRKAAVNEDSSMVCPPEG